MEYLSFDEYVSIGGVLEATAFNRYSARAFSRITQETRNRISKMEEIPEEVKHLCRDLIEYIHTYKSQELTVAGESQSQGGVSESVTYSAKTGKEIEDGIDDMIYDYLAFTTDEHGTRLLYRGCCE